MPPIRLSNVVFPEPDGPMSARNSPAGIVRFTPFNTSMRSLPRVKNLWTSRTVTRSAMVESPCSKFLLYNHLRAALQLLRRSDHDAFAWLQAGDHFHAVAVGAA